MTAVLKPMRTRSPLAEVSASMSGFDADSDASRTTLEEANAPIFCIE